MAGWRSELAGCRSTLSMSKIKVRISETKFRSFYKTLGLTAHPKGTTARWYLNKTSLTFHRIFSFQILFQLIEYLLQDEKKVGFLESHYLVQGLLGRDMPKPSAMLSLLRQVIVNTVLLRMWVYPYLAVHDLVTMKKLTRHSRSSLSTFSTLWKGPSQSNLTVAPGAIQWANGSPVIVHLSTWFPAPIKMKVKTPFLYICSLGESDTKLSSLIYGLQCKNIHNTFYHCITKIWILNLENARGYELILLNAI